MVKVKPVHRLEGLNEEIQVPAGYGKQQIQILLNAQFSDPT